MKQGLRTLLHILVVISATTPTGLCEDCGPWCKLTDSGYTIEYRQGCEELARQLMPEVQKRYGDSTSSEYADDMNLLAKHSDELRRLIAEQLAMDKPGPGINSAFERAPAMAALAGSITGCREFRVWDAGEYHGQAVSKLPGQWLSYDPVKQSCTLDIPEETWHKIPGISRIPIVIDSSLAQSPADQAVRQLDCYLQLPDTMPTAAMICHEAVEMGMTRDYRIHGAFRRWFCEGIADHITALCLERLYGRQEADKYRKMRDPDLYEDGRENVNLQCWRADEWKATTPGDAMADRLEGAHYAYAAQEIQGLVLRNGTGAIPSVFRELGKFHDRDPDAILDAIKRATGENFRKRLDKYGTKYAEPMKGLAISEVKIGLGERLADKQWRMAMEADTIPISGTSKQGLLVQFWYSTTETPVQVRCELTAPRKPDGHMVTEPCSFGCKEKEGPVWFTFTFEEDVYLPGDAEVKVYLNDNLIKEARIKLGELRPVSLTSHEAVESLIKP